MSRRFFLLAFAFLTPLEASLEISAEALYWRGREQGLGYTNRPSDVLVTDDFTQNRVIDPQFKWEWGVRLGACYQECDCLWSYQAYWTYLVSKSHGQRAFNSGAPDFLGIYPIWSMGPDTLVGDYVSTAFSHWTLHTNIVDLNIQWNIPYVCPFLGLRGVSLNQRLIANYAGGTFFSGIDENTLISRYKGAGPRLGFHADYNVGYCISLFGRAAFAPLLGRFQIDRQEVYLESVMFESSAAEGRCILSCDCAVGLQWKGPSLTAGVAWEGQAFFNANRFNRGRYHFFSRNRSLFLQGLTVSFAIHV